MPVGPGRFRVKTMPSGKKVRLHFTPKGTVNEAKAMDSGKTHTPAEFAQDRRKRKAKKTPKGNPRRRMGYDEMDSGDYGL